MGAFDHRDAGTAEQRWTGRLADVPALAPPGRDARVVVVAAHPDDETLGAGGIIAAAARAGAKVTVVVATDGEASHPGSPHWTAQRLAAVRREEVRAAVRRLAPEAELVLLGLPDGRLADGAANHTTALADALAPLVREATHLVTPWTGDRHPDHQACGELGATLAAANGIRHWQYPIWMWHWADPDGDDVPWDRVRAVVLDDAARAAKAAAVSCHESQHRPLSSAPGDEAILPPGMLEHFDRRADHVIVDAADDASRPGFFDDLYAGGDDPWGLDSRFYERRKRELLLAALPRPRFRRAFEPGCASGLLTMGLAARCDEVVAWDVADAAVEQARARTRHHPGVSVATGRIPADWPAGTFDLVVLSEVGYYCPDLAVLAARVTRSMTEDGVLVACHWRHPAAAHPHTAGAVHAALGTGLRSVVEHVETDFVLQVWSRTGESVATQEGIV